MDLVKLVPYRPGIRPVLPDSLPRYIDVELQKVSAVTTNIIQALKDLEARIGALEAP